MTVSVSPTATTRTSYEENFPVVAWLLPARVRGELDTLFHFVRLADGIADDPYLSPEERLRRLSELAPDELGRSAPYARKLIAAFKCDAVRSRSPSWEDLEAYCTLSAVPLGRFLLDLFGEGEAAYGPCDALCIALQVLTHIEDAHSDLMHLNRVYLPVDWLHDAGIDVDALEDGFTALGLREVIDRTLDKVDALLTEAARLPYVLKSFRLRLEALIVLIGARSQARRFRRFDPLINSESRRQRGISSTFRGMIRGFVGP